MKKILVSIALCTMSAVSYAQAYVQGNIGTATIFVDNGATTATNDSFSYGLGVGYQITPAFAIDLSYSELYREPGLNSNGVFVRGIFSMPINASTKFNIRFGVGKTTLNSNAGKSEGNVTFGIGAESPLNKNLSLGGAIDFYNTEKPSTITKTSQANFGFYLKSSF